MSFMDFFSNLTGGFGGFGGSSSSDLAIDLGTANTLVAVTGQGVVLNEPSVVAIERSTHRVLAVGHEAKQMINHTPDAFSAEHPLRDGVIADYDVTEAMLSAFINKAIERRYPWQAKPRIVICIPCGATSVEKRAVFEAAIQSGARQAYLIEEPMAAAMGAPVSVMETAGEGGPWGMALLAAYRLDSHGKSLADFLDTEVFANVKSVTLQADAADCTGFDAFLARYQKALPLEKTATEVL